MNLVTRNTDVVTEHESSGGGHYTRNDDDGSDFGLKLDAAGGRGRGESSGRHGGEVK